MKKLRFILVLAAVVLLVPMLFACTQNTDLSSTYTCETAENGVSVKYTLSLDESHGTYSMRKTGSPETAYSGTYNYKNGYYVLTSTDGKTEYVKTLGNVFSFFSPEEETPVCEHNYVEVSEVKGTCLSVGYKIFRCTKCSDEKREETQKGGHDLKQIKRSEGTCLVKGYTVSKCTVCNEEFTVYDENYGDHVYTDESISDPGCLKKRVARRYCKVCKQNLGEVTLDEYGSHAYGKDGVCSICHFDTAGFYHGHDSECSSVCADHDVLVAMQRDGFYLSDDKNTLYFGVYPSKRVNPSLSMQKPVEIITKDGKYDKNTGYYRYEHASYLITDKNGEKAVFSVSPIKWKKISLSGVVYYVCCSVIDRTAYLNSSSVLQIKQLDGDSKIEQPKTFYYNKKYYDSSKTTNILANDFSYSDIKTFANVDFLDKAFTELNSTKIDGTVVIPFNEDVCSAVDGGTTDYAKYTASLYGLYDSYSFFTTMKEYGEKDKTSVCDGNKVRSSDLNKQIDVSNYFGFVPVIQLKEGVIQ